MKQKGFTLIELLVVVAIIGTLSAIGVVMYSGYTKNSKATVCKTNHKKIVDGIMHTYAFCEVNESIVLRDYYSNFTKGKHYTLDCNVTNFEKSQKSVIDTANNLTNVYDPGKHWGYSAQGNTATPTIDGLTFYHTYDKTTGNARPENTTRVRTRCNGEIIESIINLE
mgnify:CR=1 FL=1